MAHQKVQIHLANTETKFDVNQVTFSEPRENKAGHLVSYVNYTDPKTGETGTPVFFAKGRFRIVFKPTEFQGKFYLQVDSGVNSVIPENSTADYCHQALYDAFKAIDDLCTEYARKNPEVWLGDPNPSEVDYIKNRNSVIKPSAPKGRVKVPDGKYSDGLKFGLPLSKKPGEEKKHLCDYFYHPKGKKFNPKDPECQWTVSQLNQGQECALVLESNGIWFPSGKYGHSVKATVVKVHASSVLSAEDSAMALGDDSDEEEESTGPGVEALGDDSEVEDEELEEEA